MTENILNLHAHIAKSAADCDGPTGSEYVEFLTDEEKAKSIAADGINDFTDIEFRNRILTSQVSVYACDSGKLTVGPAGFTWVEQTEEGYRASEVTWCDDETCTPSYSQRDLYAEMMGY